MHEDEYLQCLHFNSLKKYGNIYNQSVPIVLSCSDADKEALKNQTNVTLTYNGQTVAFMTNISVYPHRKEERCSRQFGLCHRGHPYQKFIFEECGDWLVGGELHVFERIQWNDGLDQYRLTPLELSERFKQMNVTKILKL